MHTHKSNTTTRTTTTTIGKEGLCRCLAPLDGLLLLRSCNASLNEALRYDSVTHKSNIDGRVIIFYNF